jgi:hypothetical protein
MAENNQRIKQKMFNLEQSIADWRKQMLAAGIQTPVPLVELEIHLREEIEWQVKSGLKEQKSFEISVQTIGQPKTLNREFKITEKNNMKKMMIIGAGVIGIAVGMAFVTPAAALYQKQGAIVHDATIGFLIGIPIVLAGISTAIYGFKKRKA